MAGKPLTVAETAERLGVSQSLVYALVAERRLKSVRMGRMGKRGKILIPDPDEQLKAFLAECTQEFDES